MQASWLARSSEGRWKWRSPSCLFTIVCSLAIVFAGTLGSSRVLAGDIREATALFKAGKYSECIDSAAIGIAQSPFNEPLRLIKLRAEMELGRYDQAQKTFEAALERSAQGVQVRWLGREVCRYNQQYDRVDRLDAEIFELIKRTPARYTDSANQLAIAQWMLAQQADPKQVLDTIYNELKRTQPSNAEVHIASGRMAFDKHDDQLSAESFQQAIKLDPMSADAYFGLGRALASSGSDKAEAAIKEALSLNPFHVDSLLFMADNLIDSERYKQAEEVLGQIAAINPHQPQALALKAVIAHLNNKPDAEKQSRAAALRYWTKNPQVDHLIGKKLSQKYRFAEGAAYQQQSLQFDANYLPAKEQLAQDLMRLGREEQGMKLAEEVYEADGYNILAYNLVTLQQNLSKFRSLESDGFLVRMEAREADLYGARVLDLLKRAKRSLAAKYEVELPTPIIVEIFPRQEDFAIRTFGMPGGAGFLGVCFGTVITANSPASRGTHPSCWEATLWHEFCHVVTLNKTNNKMPRWLSEGISVYEERLADPTWGQTMTPEYRGMILGEGLTPVSQLSAAFLRPPTPAHLMFAYYESSLVVQYLVERYGLDTLKRVLVDLSVGMPINESLARYTGSIDALDKEFAEYAQAQAKALAPLADWTTPELPRRASVDDITAFLKEHPNNYVALRRLAEQNMGLKQWQAAKAPLEKMRELYPQDAEAGNPYVLLARVYRELGDRANERAMLEKLSGLAADQFDVLTRLGELAAEDAAWTSVKQIALRSLAIDPLVPEPHRRAAAAAEHLDDFVLAADSHRALLMLDPADPADLHYRLAAALLKTGQRDEAKRHAMLALEETPRYRAAQRLLLEIAAQPSDNKELPTTNETPPEPSVPQR